MKTCTLLFLRRNDEILLAMKKRGFGKDRWNGVGGKVNPGETIEQAMIRECQEEIYVTPAHYWPVAFLNFQEFHDGQETHMKVYAFLCDEWNGKPEESEEMRPEWFDIDAVPYAEMWPDDEYWLPQVLLGGKLTAEFRLNEAAVIESYEVTPARAISLKEATT